MLDTIASWDLSILLFLNRTIENSFFNWFFPAITDLHKTPWFKFSFIFPLLGLWIYRDGRRGLYLVFMFFLTISSTDFIGGQGFKKVFERPRPFESSIEIIQRSPAAGFSFISNHAANSIAIAFFLGSYFPSIRLFSWIVAILIAFSRMYNGVHYPTDIIFGALVGFIIAKLVKKFADKNFQEKL